MEELSNVRFNRINYPKGGVTIVDPGTWTVGTISTGMKKRGKYESFGFVVNQDVNTGIDTKAKYNLVGTFENGKYGKQFNVQQMKIILDTKSMKGLEQALALIMSELMAQRLVRHFETPEAVIEALESRNSEELMKIKGMSENKLEDYYSSFEEKISGQEAIMALTPLGFTPKQAKSIYKKYGDMEVIMEMLDDAGMYDFYLDGAIKLNEAETVGRVKKIDFLNEKRIAALIVAYYRQPFQDDSYFTDEQMNMFIVPYLVNNCGDGLNQKHYNSALSYLNFKKATHRMDNKTGLKAVHDTEKGIYQLVETLKNGLKYRGSTITGEIIEHEISKAPFELSEEQREAVKIACTNGISIISGNAGAGKSTTLGIVTKVFKELKYDIEQVALSGKAALRIQETTELPAQTIHRMFASNTKVNAEGIKEVPDINNPYADLSQVGFYKDVLILDEASMIGGAIMLNLLKLLKKSKVKHIVIVGDDAQLPPIGVGQAFTDLLTYGNLPKAKLSRVYRQASESGILAAATMIRKNQNFIPAKAEFGEDFKHVFSMKGFEVVEEFDRMLANNDGDILETQIIAMTNLEVTRINVAIQKHLKIFSERSFRFKERGVDFSIYEGSKVMLSENQYTTLTSEGEEGGDPVFNGNIGIVKSINDDYMLIDFAGIGEVGILKVDWKALRLGYAITVHKSQGSGFNSVIAAVSSDSVQKMLSSNMLYTAITRAKKECTLISPSHIVERCAIYSAAERQTWLPVMYGGKE